MLKVNVVELIPDNTFSVSEIISTKIWNNGANNLARDLSEKFKDIVLEDREAFITIKVDRDEGLIFEKNFSFKTDL